MRVVLSVVCCVLVGCAATRVESTVTYSRRVRVRVAGSTGCAASCEQARGMTFGDCLAQCPGHLIEPGTCGPAAASEGEVCGEQLLRWSETSAGRCDQLRTDRGATVVGCTSHEVDPDPSFSETRFALGVVSAVLLGLIYLVGYGMRG